MREHSVRLTEREVKELSAVRWQRASWRKLTLFAVLLIVWIVVVWSCVSAFTTEGTAIRLLGLLGVLIPVLGFAVWLLKKAARVGREFLRDVGNKQTN